VAITLGSASVPKQRDWMKKLSTRVPGGGGTFGSLDI